MLALWEWVKKAVAPYDEDAERARRAADQKRSEELRLRRSAYLLKVRQEWAREHKVDYDRMSDKEWFDLYSLSHPGSYIETGKKALHAFDNDPAFRERWRARKKRP